MITVYSRLGLEHSFVMLLAAALVCVIGSLVAMRIFARVRRSTGARKANWLFLTGVATGSVIWTTQIVAMLGSEPSIAFAYNAGHALASFFFAIVVSLLAFWIAARTQTSYLIEVGGAVLGLGIAVKHYIGMSGFSFAGTVETDPTLMVVAAILGMFFGAVAMNRIARPVTRFCCYGGASALVLAIILTNLAANFALTITPDASIAVTSLRPSNGFIAFSILAMTSLIIGSGIATYIIESRTQTENMAQHRHLESHDPLTGLPNRARLNDLFAELLNGANGDNIKLAVVTLNLDRFEEINDVHGHSAGDRLLKGIGANLQDCLEKGEYVARVDGDEFVALKQGAYMRSQMIGFADRLIDAVSKPVEENGTELTVGASCGISVFPDDAVTTEKLLIRSNLAMKRAKSTPFDSICFYDSSMDENQRTRSALSIDLKSAIERDELEVFYQPQNAVKDGALVGFEALLRWHHVERGIISPARFIPIAESTGLIVPIGEWVLRAACKEAASWPKPYRIAVNVAPQQLSHSDLPAIVEQVLAETGLAPERLELEITESSIIDDHAHTLHVLRRLTDLGIKIAMDDFGTGYSSLSTLQAFPFDKIKIDRSFVDQVTISDQAAAIVKTTIALGSNLGIPVLAEGVETQAHLKFLRAAKCAEVQGFLFGKPMRKAEVALLVGAAGDSKPTPALMLAS